MTSPAWRLRLGTAEDDPFLRKLFAETDVALQAMPAEWRQDLAEIQYKGREITYAQHYPDAVNWIICLGDGTPVGRHLVERRPDEIRGIDLAILPAWQGKGIGTGVLTAFIDPLVRCTLRVVKGNPAIRLYRRLGFNVLREDAIAFELLWSPPSSDEAGSNLRQSPQDACDG